LELFTFFVVWGLLSWGVAALANSRGRSGFGFFLLSFIFSPLLGLIVVLVMKNLTQEAEREYERRREEENRETERKREHERQLESLRALASSPARTLPDGQSTPVAPASVADELAKLANLRDKGVLTTEEFEHQKRALLNRSSAV
jgi:hypothetical protein